MAQLASQQYRRWARIMVETPPRVIAIFNFLAPTNTANAWGDTTEVNIGITSCLLLCLGLASCCLSTFR